MNVVNKKQFSLNSWDWIKAGIIAVLTPVITVIGQTLEAGSLTFDWNVIGTVALSAFIAYLFKQFVEPDKVVIEKPNEGGEMFLSATKPHPGATPIFPPKPKS